MNRYTKLVCILAVWSVWMWIIAATQHSFVWLATLFLGAGIGAGLWVAQRMIRQAFKEDQEFEQQLRAQGEADQR